MTHVRQVDAHPLPAYTISHLDWKLQQVAVEIESQVRGWYNYYKKFGKTEFVKVMNHLNMVLAYWVRRREISPPDYVYAQNVECEEPCEGRLSRTVL